MKSMALSKHDEIDTKASKHDSSAESLVTYKKITKVQKKLKKISKPINQLCLQKKQLKPKKLKVTKKN